MSPAMRVAPSVHPRRRGEHPSARSRCLRTVRFIPAGAGNTAHPSEPIQYPSVHPRRRGEHLSGRLHVVIKAGSSPQARGTLIISPVLVGWSRFIPAGAGNTLAARRRWLSMSVHPRRRGEHLSGRLHVVIKAGSSPQARGTLIISPVLVGWSRFIPAGAGNTLAARRRWLSMSVHPRRRGEHAIESPIPENVLGSSPQARGTPYPMSSLLLCLRFIPAGAGNT